MNYHNITYPDMNNGSGLRVVLWLSGCNHHCKNCQNPQTWDVNSGILFDESAKEELFRELGKDYISGITLTGGDPLHENNLDEVISLIKEIRERFPSKTIWLYTGYVVKLVEHRMVDLDYNIVCGYSFMTENPSKNAIDNFKRASIIGGVDVVVDGEYKEELRDVSLHWVGSSNQRVIDIKKSIEQKRITTIE